MSPPHQRPPISPANLQTWLIYCLSSCAVCFFLHPSTFLGPFNIILHLHERKQNQYSLNVFVSLFSACCLRNGEIECGFSEKAENIPLDRWNLMRRLLCRRDVAFARSASWRLQQNERKSIYADRSESLWKEIKNWNFVKIVSHFLKEMYTVGSCKYLLFIENVNNWLRKLGHQCQSSRDSDCELIKYQESTRHDYCRLHIRSCLRSKEAVGGAVTRWRWCNWWWQSAVWASW